MQTEAILYVIQPPARTNSPIEEHYEVHPRNQSAIFVHALCVDPYSDLPGTHS